MKKRWLALLLSMIMALGMLSGCGSGENAGGSSAGENASDKEKTTGDDASADSTQTLDTPEINFDEEPYEATFMYLAGNDARDLQTVEDAFNELTLAQLNMKVDLMPMTMGTYMQQIQMILSSDDKLDVFPYMSTVMNSYIEAEYIVDLSPYLDTTLKNTVEAVGMEDIACGYMGDFLGGIPTMHERTNPTAFVMRTDILEETGFTADDIKTARDMTQIFAKVKELHPEMTVYGGRNNMAYPILMANSMVDPLGGGFFGVLMDHGQSTDVVNFYETDVFMDACQMMYEWYEAGYIAPDMATSPDSGESLMRAGNVFCFTTSGKPNTKVEKDSMTGYDTTCVNVTPDVCYTATTNALLYTVAANSEDPDKAAILLNWVYTTKEASDLINWGIEGKDYVVLEDGTIDYPEGVSKENVGYHQDFGFAIPNQYIGYTWTGNEPDVWEQYQEVRNNAQVSKAYGFFFDASNVINELSALQSVYEEFIYTVSSGVLDPETAVEEFNEKLYDAGLEDVMKEKQAQLDAWLAEQ